MVELFFFCPRANAGHKAAYLRPTSGQCEAARGTSPHLLHSPQRCLETFVNNTMRDGTVIVFPEGLVLALT